MLGVKLLMVAMLVVCSCVAGCASQPQDPAPTAARHYTPSASGALAFDAPVRPPFPLNGLSREGREPQAVLGYDQQISETYVIYTDDNQGDTPYLSQYNREAVSAKVGIRSR